MVNRSFRLATCVMSSSTRSKPVSESSPVAGPADDSSVPAATAKTGETVAIALEPSRQRAISWTFFGIVFGTLLVWRLGTVAVWVGWVLIAVGIFRAYQLVRSFLYPAGTIEVSAERVVLPLGLHKSK